MGSLEEEEKLGSLSTCNMKPHLQNGCRDVFHLLILESVESAQAHAFEEPFLLGNAYGWAGPRQWILLFFWEERKTEVPITCQLVLVLFQPKLALSEAD